MLKAAIVLDSWKLPIFKRYLSEAGLEFEQEPGVTDNTLTLTVDTIDMNALAVLVKNANTEARRSKMQ